MPPILFDLAFAPAKAEAVLVYDVTRYSPAVWLGYGRGLMSEVKTLGVSCVPVSRPDIRGRNEGNVMYDYWAA